MSHYTEINDAGISYFRFCEKELILPLNLRRSGLPGLVNFDAIIIKVVVFSADRRAGICGAGSLALSRNAFYVLAGNFFPAPILLLYLTLTVELVFSTSNLML